MSGFNWRKGEQELKLAYHFFTFAHRLHHILWQPRQQQLNLLIDLIFIVLPLNKYLTGT